MSVLARISEMEHNLTKQINLDVKTISTASEICLSPTPKILIYPQTVITFPGGHLAKPAKLCGRRRTNQSVI